MEQAPKSRPEREAGDLKVAISPTAATVDHLRVAAANGDQAAAAELGRRIGRRETMFANAYEYKGVASVSLIHDSAVGKGRGGVSSCPVNRPAIRVGDRWLRRCPELEVVAI